MFQDSCMFSILNGIPNSSMISWAHDGHVTNAWNIKMSIWTPIGYQGLVIALRLTDEMNIGSDAILLITGDTQVNGFLGFPKDLGFLKETNWVFETCMCPGFSIHTYNHSPSRSSQDSLCYNVKVSHWRLFLGLPSGKDRKRQLPFNLCWVPFPPYEAFNACSETQKYFSISSKAQVQSQVRKWNDIMYMRNEKALVGT